jgi:hypothetical protein
VFKFKPVMKYSEQRLQNPSFEQYLLQRLDRISPVELHESHYIHLALELWLANYNPSEDSLTLNDLQYHQYARLFSQDPGGVDLVLKSRSWWCLLCSKWGMSTRFYFWSGPRHGSQLWFAGNDWTQVFDSLRYVCDNKWQAAIEDGTAIRRTFRNDELKMSRWTGDYDARIVAGKRKADGGHISAWGASEYPR